MPFPSAFPTTDDLTHLSMDDARRALRALALLVQAGAAEVYDFSRPDRSLFHDWSVWLPITRRHLTLAAWATEWLADQQDHPTLPPFGGDAA